jgi:phosphate transport system protein
VRIRSSFHNKLGEIQNEIIAMGDMVHNQIQDSVAALGKRDFQYANTLIEADKNINRRKIEIEEKCINLIATQQPMAGDLRIILGALSIISELERMGDYAVAISKIVLVRGDDPALEPEFDIIIMAKMVGAMLNLSLEAFINSNCENARKISRTDTSVNNLHDRIFSDLIHLMTVEPKSIKSATHLIRVAHNLERSADRVTNICERIVFIADGELA